MEDLTYTPIGSVLHLNKAEDKSGDFAYQLRSGDGKRIFWEHNPTAATPAETVRIVRVEIVRDFDKSYYANLYDENGGGHNLSKEYTDFRTLTSLCKKEYGVNLPNLSQMEFETHGRKSYAYISTETPQKSTETAEMTNVSAEGENTAETAKYSNPEGTDENAPQSPETPQTIKHNTRTDKPREMARKEPRRTISKMERVHARQKLGAQGYLMLADASAILAAINAPPIRGDCEVYW